MNDTVSAILASNGISYHKMGLTVVSWEPDVSIVGVCQMWERVYFGGCTVVYYIWKEYFSVWYVNILIVKGAEVSALYFKQ